MLPEFKSLKVMKCEVKDAKEVSGKTGKFTIKCHVETGFASANGEVGVFNTDLPEGATRANSKVPFNPGDVVQLDDCYSMENLSGVWAVRSAVLSPVQKRQ